MTHPHEFTELMISCHRQVFIGLIRYIAHEQGGINAVRPEADNYAFYVVKADGTLVGDGYAEGITWEAISLHELAWLLSCWEKGDVCQ